MQVSKLVELVTMIRPGEESDYFLLHTIISFVGFAVGSEDLPSRERVRIINIDFVVYAQEILESVGRYGTGAFVELHWTICDYLFKNVLFFHLHVNMIQTHIANQCKIWVKSFVLALPPPSPPKKKIMYQCSQTSRQQPPWGQVNVVVIETCSLWGDIGVI